MNTDISVIRGKKGQAHFSANYRIVSWDVKATGWPATIAASAEENQQRGGAAVRCGGLGSPDGDGARECAWLATSMWPGIDQTAASASSGAAEDNGVAGIGATGSGTPGAIE